MASSATPSPSTSSSGTPASPGGAPVPAGNAIAERARAARAAMAARVRRGGQRGFMELYANLARNPTRATLLNTASDLKEVRQPALRNWGEHLERRLEIGADIGTLVTDTKAYIRMYLSPAERRQLVEQRVFGGRKKTRKGKSRRRYTRRR